ncbi:hypothetical protein OZ12_17525 [Xanthomonas translucens pv. translucens]|nr:hypothetical protein OZ12_17525 [Xanthomonas translucens pv. translucens]KWV12813.1 hypothetical protein ATB54_15075 [Xanthomonas translucens]OAX63565.1 hypothetical protein A6R79_05560 [Xanthomonas translucens pv. translucens]
MALYTPLMARLRLPSTTLTQRGAGRFVGVTQATGVQRAVGVAGVFQATEAGQPIGIDPAFGR